MLVNAAFVPPAAALAELTEAVRAGRRTARDGEPPVLVDVPAERLQVPITEFGNLTVADAHRLAERIRDAATAWPVPVLRFAGGAALEFPGDWSVWARLDGDVDMLTTIARGVTRCVEQLGLFVDRRLFRPMLSVATVTESTTGPDLDQVVGALDEFRGREWTVDSIVLTTEGFEDGRPARREFQRVPVGG